MERDGGNHIQLAITQAEINQPTAAAVAANQENFLPLKFSPMSYYAAQKQWHVTITHSLAPLSDA